jgi:hypothetical protein
MPDGIPSLRRIPRALFAWGLLLVLLSTTLVFPSAARAPDIRHIQGGDMIFIYEQSLDITGLRAGAPVTSLRKYRDDDPAKALLREVAVQDDTSFTPIPEAFAEQYGVYYAFNPGPGAMNSVLVSVPSVSIDAVLANPNHVYSIQGLTIPEDTPIAFKVASVDIASYYHVGALYPATVDLVLTVPGGAQRTSVQGKDFSAMSVSSPVFYTDDPGRPGAITLEGLGAGTYSLQAKWRDPASFDMQAPDSNTLTFSVGRTTTISQTTPAPVTTVITAVTTISTPAPTTSRPTPPPTTATTATTPAVQPVTPTATGGTGTPAPSPTSTPMGAWLAFLAPAFALLPGIRGRGR